MSWHPTQHHRAGGSQTGMTSCLGQGLEPLLQGWAQGMLVPWESKANSSLNMGGGQIPVLARSCRSGSKDQHGFGMNGQTLLTRAVGG